MENNVSQQQVSPVPTQPSVPNPPLQPLSHTENTHSHPLIVMAVICLFFVLVAGVVLVINKRSVANQIKNNVTPAAITGTAAPKAQDFITMAVAIRSGDATKFASVTTDIDPAKVDPESLSTFAASQDFTFNPATFTVEPDDPNTATVQANITFADKPPTLYRVVLRSFNGKWLVDTILPIK